MSGPITIIIAALLWSLDGIFFRPNLYALPTILVVFLEHFLGFLALSPLLFRHRAQLKFINSKTWTTIFWVSLFGGALGTIFITKALFLTGFHDTSVVILLQKFQPIFAIMAAAILLKEKFPAKFYYLAISAVIAGYFVTFKNPLIVTHLPANSYLVPLLALLAAFAWGSSTAVGKYPLCHIHYGLLAALRFGLTSLILICPTIYFYHSTFALVNFTQWMTLLAIVFSSGAAAMYLYYYGLKKTPASIATLCELAWPVSAIIFDYFLNGNVLSLTQLIGTGILIYIVYLIIKLTQPKTLSGQVIKGQNRGSKINFPTANLPAKLGDKLAPGVYTCLVKVKTKIYHGLLFFGFNSLRQEKCLEVHLLDFTHNLYGQKITITTLSYLRDQKKFVHVKDLKRQITQDIKQARAIFA